MSTLKTTFIQHPSAEEPSIELSADGTIVLPLSDLEDLANVDGTPTDGQFLAWNSSTSQWEPTTMSVKEKRIEAFTGSGTWTVPAGVTYAIAHMMGGGGGIGEGGTGGNGSASSVDFASGLVSATGMPKTLGPAASLLAAAGAANTGQTAFGRRTDNGEHGGGVGVFVVNAAAVTPAATIAVVVGAGGSAGTNGAAGGSGYVYIEYYEEV